MTKKNIIDFIFIPRKSNKPKDSIDHLINFENDISISSRFFLKDKNYHNILFFHGNGEICHDYDDIAEYYHHFKLNFIIADYRGYGLSNGKPNKDNLHSDSLEIFSYVKSYLTKEKYNKGISIMGRSLGSASACHIIANFEDDITSCIIESGFATEFPLLELRNIEPHRIDFKLEDGFENLKKIKSYKKPLLLIHADLDDIIPISQAEMMLIKSSSKVKDLYKVEGANHNNILMISRESYFKRINEFINFS